MKMQQKGIIVRKPGGQTAKTVCFSCRKCFHKLIPHCVECKSQVHCVGAFFRAPKKTDIKEWKIIEKLVVLAGYRFSQHGANGFMPDTARGADAIIRAKIKDLEPKLYKNTWVQLKNSKGQLLPKKFTYGIVNL